MDTVKARQTFNNQRFTAKLNEHVNDCQVCQLGTLCEIAERIIVEAEQEHELDRQRRKQEREKQARL